MKVTHGNYTMICNSNMIGHMSLFRFYQNYDIYELLNFYNTGVYIVSVYYKPKVSFSCEKVKYCESK